MRRKIEQQYKILITQNINLLKILFNIQTYVHIFELCDYKHFKQTFVHDSASYEIYFKIQDNEHRIDSKTKHTI